MTRDERSALRHLESSKNHAKDAFRTLDPAVTDPVARAILRIIDSIDVAIRAIKDREGI